MIKIKHATRRKSSIDEGIILVGTQKYFIDEKGEVEVSEEHSKLMLQGKMWSLVPVEIKSQPTKEIIIPKEAKKEDDKKEDDKPTKKIKKVK